jgi:predicted NBD/HSP70 family sugar kinase
VTQLSPVGRQLRPQRKVLQEDARRHHRALLLQQLFSRGPASRADLARATALTRVTVSDLVGEMIRDGLLEELGAPVESRVGKPPTLVGFVPDAAHVVCLDLSVEDTMTGAIINHAGTVLTRRAVDTGGATGADALTLVHRLAADLVAEATRPVLGIGVGTPGVVDADGTVLDAPNLGWADVHLARSLHEALGLPVFVANDANTAALAEHTFGHAGEGGLMLVRVGKGVGAGLILGGQLLHGHRAAAGEIGHVVIDPAGTTCACGRVGCLETVLGVPRLRARLEHDGPAALGQVGELLGTVLAPVVGALNLHELVLSGPTDLLDGPLREVAAATIRRNTMAVSGDHLVVRTSTLGDDVVLVGAAALVLAGELGVS